MNCTDCNKERRACHTCGTIDSKKCQEHSSKFVKGNYHYYCHECFKIVKCEILDCFNEKAPCKECFKITQVCRIHAPSICPKCPKDCQNCQATECIKLTKVDVSPVTLDKLFNNNCGLVPLYDQKMRICDNCLGGGSVLDFQKDYYTRLTKSRSS